MHGGRVEMQGSALLRQQRAQGWPQRCREGSAEWLSSRRERLVLESLGMVCKGCLQILHDKPEAGAQVLEEAVVIPEVNLQARVLG